MQVLVRENNVDQALRALKKKMQREGIFREMKQRSAYEKPSERKVREKAEAGRIAVGYREPGYARTAVHEYVGSAQDQRVTAFRQTAGKSYPSPDRNGRATSCTCSRTLACSSGGSDRRTGEMDADVSVR